MMTKTIEPSDFAELASELAVVDKHFTAAREQHPMRRWEYALALRAHDVWLTKNTDFDPLDSLITYDVGGAGSPFELMLRGARSDQTTIVDPDQPDGCTLAQFVRGNPPLADQVFCLSVLEHVEDVEQFLYHLNCLVAPGGLLFLTMDVCGCQQSAAPDTHHFHWMRKRIFTSAARARLVHTMRPYGFSVFGLTDWTYHGDHVYDYSFGSLALVKRR